MPHPFNKGTAFTSFPRKAGPFPSESEPTGALRRSICKPSIENLPEVGASVLSGSFVPVAGPETNIITEPWEDILAVTLIASEGWETPTIAVLNIFTEDWEGAPANIGVRNTTSTAEAGRSVAWAVPDSKVGTVSLWLLPDPTIDGQNVTIFQYNPDFSSSFILRIAKESSDKFRISASSDDGSSGFGLNSGEARTSSDGWFHVLVSWDLTAGIKQLYINGVEDDDMSGVVVDGGPPIEYTTVGGESGLFTFALGGGIEYFGCIGEFWMDLSIFTDFTVPANRAKFIDGSLFPVDLGTTGQTPFAFTPQFYFRGVSGDPNDFFVNQGTAGQWETILGSVVDCGVPIQGVLGGNAPHTNVWHTAGTDATGFYVSQFEIGSSTWNSGWAAGKISGPDGVAWGANEAGTNIFNQVETFSGVVLTLEQATTMLDFPTVGLFVAASDGEDVEVFSSTDGTTYAIDQTVNGVGGLISSEVFGGNAYFGGGTVPGGVSNTPDVWQRTPGGVWTMTHNFTGANDVSALKTFGSFLYAGVKRGFTAEVWRSSDGSTWNLVHTFPASLFNIPSLEVFDGDLYAAVWGDDREIWRTSDGTTWSSIFALPNPTFAGVVTQLYADGTDGLFVGLGDPTVADAKIYGTEDGDNWELSVDFNATFFDTNFAVTAVGGTEDVGGGSATVAAATGSLDGSTSPVRFYVCPEEFQSG